MEWMVTSHTGKNSQGLCDKIEEAMVDFEEAMGQGFLKGVCLSQKSKKRKRGCTNCVKK